MGFCKPSDTEQFYKECPKLEQIFVNAGIQITKFWFDVECHEQSKRFESRQTHPLKVGKMSAVDLSSVDKWDDYTDAYNRMIRETSKAYCPWVWVDSNNKQKARVAAMQYVLTINDYLGKDQSAIGVIDPEVLKVL